MFLSYLLDCHVSFVVWLIILRTKLIQVGTPICVPQKDFIDIGRIASVENNHKPVDYAKKGQKVAIKV